MQITRETSLSHCMLLLQLSSAKYAANFIFFLLFVKNKTGFAYTLKRSLGKKRYPKSVRFHRVVVIMLT